MKNISRLLAVLLALVLLLPPTNAHRIASAEAQKEQTEYGMTACAPAITAEQSTQDDRAEVEAARSDRCLTEEDVPIRACERDGNGSPITGQTWKDSVYLSCPPEGTPV